ncbi:DUF86 domain-containing protein [Candidatus Poriferisocius sp.]|uniref:HepT-like ribonuclease domain-containing protein n=1 Tax=Candidatus Poriferisocius sp. TaxID=3101276 RepID=UPI003B015EB0
MQCRCGRGQECETRIRAVIRRCAALVKSDEDLIEDILEAARELAIVVSRGRSRYDSDFEPRRTTERLVEIIGEAAGSLTAELKQRRSDLPLREAKATRNFLIHDYGRVDHDALWQIAEDEVPRLAAALGEELRNIQHGRPSGESAQPNEGDQFQGRPEMPITRFCGASTETGQPCRHPLPTPGQECPDGHRRL